MQTIEQGVRSEVSPNVYYYVDNQVPYAAELFVPSSDADLFLNRSSSDFGPAYRRWQTVRHASDFTNHPLTGFEAAYIGYDLDANQIKEDISAIGRQVQNGMLGSKMRYWNTLTGEKVHYGSMLHLQDIYASILARLRAKVLQSPNPTGRDFRESIYVSCGENAIQLFPNGKQKVDIPFINGTIPSELHEPSGYPEYIDPSDPYGLMLLIGKVGHPIAREVIISLSDSDKKIYLQQLL